uniref:Uncharacterized protein n=1 Tax=Strongyloides papillosus TaxID=174720 RepID=A0A0N5B7I9_STREA
MIFPVYPHKLIKISPQNRVKLIKFSLLFSSLACTLNCCGISTNSWLYTSEVLKYYVYPNKTNPIDDPYNKIIYYKNATFGPWKFCWLDPVVEFKCNTIDFFSLDEPADVTTSIEVSLRKAIIPLLLSLFFDINGFIAIIICCIRSSPYKSLFFSTVLHIFAGIAKFVFLIIYMSAVTKEAGYKIYKASEMDDPLFYYTYGYSFICVKVGFLCTEITALLSTVVYMSRRDAKTYERYKMRSIMKSLRTNSGNIDPIMSHDNYVKHSRAYQMQKTKNLTFTDLSIV